MATPVFCCGAECGVNGAHMTLTGTGSISTSIVRSGSRSFRTNPTAATVSTYQNSTAFASSNVLVFRVYVYFASLPTVTTAITSGGGGTAAGAYYNSSDGKIYAGSGTTTKVLGATGVAVTTGVWYRLDVRLNQTNNPWLIDVSVDGVACCQCSNALAAVEGTIVILDVVNNVNVTADIYYDDLIVSQTSDDYPFGAGYINHFVPTADGTHNVAGANDFEIGTGGTDINNATTTAYQLVDDVPLQSGAIGTTDFINMVAPPNATNYVECIFGPAPGISTPTTAPRAVEVISGDAQAGTGAGNMEVRLNDNGTTDAVISRTGTAGTTTIKYARKHYAAGPAGAWVIGGGGNGDFTDLRVQFGSPGTLDVNPDQYFTGIMIEAEFEEVLSKARSYGIIIG